MLGLSILLIALVINYTAFPVDVSHTFSRHGGYSESYQKDWSILPTGKNYKRKHNENNKIPDEFGEDIKKKYFNKKQVHIKGIALRVRWKRPYNKYGNALYLIRGCDQVIVEDVAIIQRDSDYRASHSILIEDCKEVVIKNSYFAGTTNNYHIRVEGCETVFVDNIEISGFDYGKEGIRCGGGIFINNGDPKAGGKHGMLSPNPRNLKWCVIQNCYVHDNINSDRARNQDGILLHSASDGIVFNCYFENWEQGDAALDVSHRREDSAYRNHVLRVERNIFKNCKFIKTPGKSDKSCKILFSNNVYINTSIVDYHKGWDVYHVHETYVFYKDRLESVFFKLSGIADGITYFNNGLLYVFDKKLYTVYHQSANSKRNDYLYLKPDYFVYLMPAPKYWVKGKCDFIPNWNEWRKDSDRDIHSLFVAPGKCFKDPWKDDYRLLPNSPAVRFGSKDFQTESNISMRVDKDFNGNSRNSKPSAGAFEVE